MPLPSSPPYGRLRGWSRNLRGVDESKVAWDRKPGFSIGHSASLSIIMNHEPSSIIIKSRLTISDHHLTISYHNPTTITIINHTFPFIVREVAVDHAAEAEVPMDVVLEATARVMRPMRQVDEGHEVVFIWDHQQVTWGS